MSPGRSIASKSIQASPPQKKRAIRKSGLDSRRSMPGGSWWETKLPAHSKGPGAEASSPWAAANSSSLPTFDSNVSLAQAEGTEPQGHHVWYKGRICLRCGRPHNSWPLLHRRQADRKLFSARTRPCQLHQRGADSRAVVINCRYAGETRRPSQAPNVCPDKPFPFRETI